MLDFDHAEMYQVETRVLKVKRNIEHFPKGFMFQLSVGYRVVARPYAHTCRRKNGWLSHHNL